MRHSILVLSTVLLASSCGGQAVTTSDQSDAGPARPTTTPAAGQRILFELSYINYAWGLAISGAYVTEAGEVYAYDFVQASAPDAGIPYVDLVPGMTEDEVTQKYGPSSKLVGTVEKDTLLGKFALVGGARLGTLLTQGGCADYGEARYVGYLFDASTSRYTPVMLGTDGDMAMHNTAPEAEQLLEWIRTVAGESGERACQYQASTCYGTLCPDAAPCSPGSVPMYPSEDGCMTYCGPPSRCESVPDCSACAADGSACVVDERGGVHCVAWLPGCSDGVTCACGGDALCAAGASSCRGTAATGLSCAQP